MTCRRCNAARHVHHSVYFDGWFCTSCLDHLWDIEEVRLGAPHNARAARVAHAPHMDGDGSPSR